MSRPEENELDVRGVHLLYIAYWGVREPLGQALMVPPLLRFARAGMRVTLVSFEKPHHLADRAGVEESRRQFKAAGIRWLPLRYHKRPTAPATAFDIAQGIVRSVLVSQRRPPDIVLGRSYLGGLIAQRVSRILRKPFVFHSEGFWPDEQIDGGRWTAGSRPYKMTKGWESAMFRRADAVITLTHAAREIVSTLRRHKSADSIVVVPSCVDLERFQPAADTSATGAACRMIYIGSLGFRYRGEEMARFVRVARREMPLSLTILSHSEADMIRDVMRAEGVEDPAWSLDFVPHTAMPAMMQRHDAGLFFLVQGASTRVCSPTKIGEYWACGLPVVTTPGVGDVDAVVRRERVGVVVEADTEEAHRAAARELRELLADPDLPQRCRAMAETYYSLERGVETQLRLYRRLALHRRKRATR